MKLNFNLIIILFLLIFSTTNLFAKKISIEVIIEDKIITNFEISKEFEYLKILNPNLKNLNEEQKYKLAKKSLIKEIIKKKEITKNLNYNEKNYITDEYLSNLALRLGYENTKKFEEDLKYNNTYSIEEIKSKINIEFYWNELIFNKFSNQIKINEDELISKIDEMSKKIKKSYFLSEIIFKEEKNEDLNDTLSKILKAIDDIGFNNTANLYSLSDSSKFGGKVGWIDESFLSPKIIDGIKKLKINEISKPIKISNSLILLKVEDIKFIENKIDKKNELIKIKEIEKNKKLEKFSRIYFDKVTKNYSINEK
jgi:peptidyl-prolyl cis-trans isomerase SurA